MIIRIVALFAVTAALATGCGGSSEGGDAPASEAAPDPKSVTCADFAKLDAEAQTNLVTDILEITDADKDKKQDPAAVLPMASALCGTVPDATVYEVLATPPASVSAPTPASEPVPTPSESPTP